jgi:phage tail-like protein
MAEGADPLVGTNFFLELDGAQIASFKECSGIEIEVTIVEHEENIVGGKPVLRKIPGKNKYTPIVFKKGQTDSKVLWEKFQKSLTAQNSGGGRPGGFKRMTGAIVIMDVTGSNEVARYEFVEAWISKYKAGELNASGSNMSLEEITIVHEGMKRTK